MTQSQPGAREALPSVADVIEKMRFHRPNWNGYGQSRDAAVDLAIQCALELCRAALASPEVPASTEAQPVALMWQHDETGRVTFTQVGDPHPGKRWHRIPLYAAPPTEPQKDGLSSLGWRGIDDEPPPHEVPVLLYSQNGEIEARPYSHGPVGSRSFHGWATHWMPLPAAPKKEAAPQPDKE